MQSLNNLVKLSAVALCGFGSGLKANADAEVHFLIILNENFHFLNLKRATLLYLFEIINES